MAQWVKDQGGVDVSPKPLKRAQAIADRLAAGNPDLRVRVCVLATKSPSAFSWPDHSVFVTRGLLDRLTDEELAAAIAHELGHLLNDGHVQTAYGLHGRGEPLDAEARADATGIDLLESKGVRADAMASMLTKVCNSGSVSGACGDALRHRIQLLNDREGRHAEP
jgi:Zn-dependent protease with chaperone function